MGAIVFDENVNEDARVQSVTNNIVRKFHNAPGYNYVHKNPVVVDQSSLLDRKKTDITFVDVNATPVAIAPHPGNARPQCATTKTVGVPSQSDRLQRLTHFSPGKK
jgi:hypothetical protein